MRSRTEASARRRVARAAGGLLCLVVLVGCAPGADPAVDEFDVDVPVDFLLAVDFADPDLLAVDGGWLAYATQSEEAHVQMAASGDLEEWSLVETDPFPDLPDWVREGDTWAPDVVARKGRYLLFHTSTDDASGRQCIGVAASDDPRGPFREVGTAPLLCPEDGAIDPSFFEDDDGSAHLLWKEDGNCCGGTGRIMLTPLVDDGTAVAGESAVLLEKTRLWEGDVVEAPTLVRRPDGYALFYSGGDYSTLDYGIGWARSSSLTGPYTAGEDPLLDTDLSDLAYIGPGGQDVVGDTLFFHSWDASHSFRGLHSAPVTWEGGVPTVGLPRPPD